MASVMVYFESDTANEEMTRARGSSALSATERIGNRFD